MCRPPTHAARVGRATPCNEFMNLAKPVAIALAIAVAAQVTSAAEAIRSTHSLGDLSMFVTLERFRIEAEHCSARVPQLKPRFDSLMDGLSRRIQGISTSLLSSDAFKDIKDKRAPAEIEIAFKDSIDDSRHNFERQDAESICPKSLQRLGEMDDDTLKADLWRTLMALKTMTRHLEKGGASDALRHPDDIMF